MVSDYEQNTVECGKHEMMDMNPKDILMSWHEKRLRFIEVSKENGFEEGLRNLLSNLYPDKAHFIYELLQNAEDAKATEVNFRLTQTNLTLKHNGTRIFDETDVKGITGIGTNTQKRDDINVIGKFGVGFKAVFAYTETPRIYSRDFSFEIKDLLCPYPIETIDISDSDTQFVFPFNNLIKRPEDCFNETAEGLNGLGDTTLLFLNNIETITWDIEGQDRKHITRIATKQDNIIEIKRHESNGQNPNSSFWLRFQRNTKLSDKLKIGVAFKLKVLSNGKEADGSNLGPNSHMKIDSEIDDGKLFIFFPAEKETTKLKFHINGPYASTIDRASIPQAHDDNKLLLEETATLLAESLPAIRDAGYLTKDFLNILPNKNDYLDAFYQPFIEKISSAMKEQPLVPTESGTHVCADNLLIGSQKVRKLISDDDLRFFTGKEGVYWAPGVFQYDRADRFLQMLEIDSWKENELLEGLDTKYGINAHYDEEEYVEQRQADDIWLSNKTDEWMQYFYAYLADQKKYPYTATRKSQWRILRTEDGEHLRSNDGVFFPTEESTSGVGEVSFIKSAILSRGDKSLIEDVRTFLDEVGVKEVDEEQKIKYLLEMWYSSDNKCPEEKEHLAHMKRFISWCQKEGAPSIFGDYDIFRDTIYPEQPQFWHADSCFIDLPFKDTGLSALYDYSEFDITEGNIWMVPLWEQYKELGGFLDFAISLGVVDKLKINKINTWSNPYKAELHNVPGKYYRKYAIDEDHSIDKLDEYLSRKNINVSKLIWNTMCNADPKDLTAKYSPNESSRIRYGIQKAPSSLVFSLKKHRWIPNRNGEFCKPAEMTKNQLQDGFYYDDRNCWLSDIGFAKNAIAEDSDVQTKKQYAHALGIENLDSIDIIKKIEADPDFKSYVRNYDKYPITFDPKSHFGPRQQSTKLPKGSDVNKERYERKMREKVKSAPKIEYVQTLVSQRVSSEKIDAKIWLREEYKNEDEKIICQICKNEMPFKTRKGECYFEDVESFDDFDREIEQLHLALCPVCAAKYKEFIKPKNKNGGNELKRDKMQKFKSAILENKSQIIPIQLDENKTVYFTKKHLLAIKTLIEEQERKR